MANPWNIIDPQSYIIPQLEDIFLFGNPLADMSQEEFNKHKLNAKHLCSIKRFEKSQCFILNTQSERQLENYRVLMEVLKF